VVSAAVLAAVGAATAGFALTGRSPGVRVVAAASTAEDLVPTTTLTATGPPTTETTQATLGVQPTSTTVPSKSTSSTTRPVASTTTTTARTRTTSVPTTERASTTTTTAIVCRDSLDPACGAFRWDPQPDNGPLTVKVTVLTPHPTAGEPVQLKVVLDDPDARIDAECFTTQSFGDDTPSGSCIADYPGCPEPKRYGPWTPPAKRTDHRELILSHTYDAGTYTATFGYYSMGVSCMTYPDPYGSSGTGTATFTVAPATQPKTVS